MSPTSTVSGPAQYLTFAMAGEEFAVEILHVREILSYEVVTKVPSCPPWIHGLMNLRGSVVPVVDLAMKFGLAASTISSQTCIVIVEVDSGDQATVMGVLADSVNQVVDLKPEDIEPPPPFGTHVRVDFLLGMGRGDKRFLLLLDTGRVLSTEELLAVETLAGDEIPGPPALAKEPAATGGEAQAKSNL